MASKNKKGLRAEPLTSLGLILSSGGPVAMTWGLCVSAVGSLAMCTTLAEICHVYPTVGGQYDWAYVLAPERYRRGLAWIAGWMTAVSATSITDVFHASPFDRR